MDRLPRGSNKQEHSVPSRPFPHLFVLGRFIVCYCILLSTGCYLPIEDLYISACAELSSTSSVHTHPPIQSRPFLTNNTSVHHSACTPNIHFSLSVSASSPPHGSLHPSAPPGHLHPTLSGPLLTYSRGRFSSPAIAHTEILSGIEAGKTQTFFVEKGKKLTKTLYIQHRYSESDSRTAQGVHNNRYQPLTVAFFNFHHPSMPPSVFTKDFVTPKRSTVDLSQSRGPSSGGSTIGDDVSQTGVVSALVSDGKESLLVMDQRSIRSTHNNKSYLHVTPHIVERYPFVETQQNLPPPLVSNCTGRGGCRVVVERVGGGRVGRTTAESRLNAIPNERSNSSKRNFVGGYSVRGHEQLSRRWARAASHEGVVKSFHRKEGHRTKSSLSPSDWSHKHQGVDWWQLPCFTHHGGDTPNGLAQSPINIGNVEQLLPGRPDMNVSIKYSRACSQYSVMNDGHSIQVAPIGSGHASIMGEVLVDGDVYTARQFHFHAPAEHTFMDKLPAQSPMGGKKQRGAAGDEGIGEDEECAALEYDRLLHRRDLELHIVHLPVDSSVTKFGTVLGFTFTVSPTDTRHPFLQSLLDLPGFPPSPPTSSQENNFLPDGGARPSLDFAGLVESASTEGSKVIDVYRYDGSLTTPPMSEGINWVVVKTPLEASRSQLAVFQKAMLECSQGGLGNYRMIQNSLYVNKFKCQVYTAHGTITAHERLPPRVANKH
eukprot:GHVQ01009597.1.p1 GENE.GHVQ01009597.1~~GHVQ01009597.1.p1  ORF type:complete len:712 (+),score=94.81 GHVQ01009597.1:203-2338(+)